MPAVSDTSPILGLASIGQLGLLHDQFGAVFIPRAVLAELKTDTDFRGTSVIRDALQSGWLEAREVQNIPLVQALAMELDNGEAEALALATDLGIEIIVMDEHDGRMRARAMGLNDRRRNWHSITSQKRGKDSIASGCASILTGTNRIFYF